MIRSIRPTDLLTLAYFIRLARPNEVRTLDTLGKSRSENSSLTAIAFVKHWLSLEENRHTWIYLRNHRIRGLISTRSLAGPSVWEVDRLQLAGGESDDLYLDLLDYLCLVGGETGMEKVFLRFPKDSALVEMARHAGFLPYLEETLYRLDQKGKLRSKRFVTLPDGLRPKLSADDYSVFQLYNTCMPECVRKVEAMTLREWQQIHSRNSQKFSKDEYVSERDGQVVAWLGLFSHGPYGYIEVMVAPYHLDLLDNIVTFAVASLGEKRTVLALVPEFEERLGHALLERGFGEGDKYRSLARQLTVRLRQPRLVPKQAWSQAPR